MGDNIKCNKYRPLPNELYVGMSDIEGNGLFTTEFIEKGRKFGISHIKNDSGDFHSNYIRTPLAAFVNHDPINPNCTLYECDGYLKMKTITDIHTDDELTLNYFLQDPCKDYISEKCKDHPKESLPIVDESKVIKLQEGTN